MPALYLSQLLLRESKESLTVADTVSEPIAEMLNEVFGESAAVQLREVVGAAGPDSVRIEAVKNLLKCIPHQCRLLSAVKSHSLLHTFYAADTHIRIVSTLFPPPLTLILSFSLSLPLYISLTPSVLSPSIPLSDLLISNLLPHCSERLLHGRGERLPHEGAGPHCEQRALRLL
jgi:hypothetical protein